LRVFALSMRMRSTNRTPPRTPMNECYPRWQRGGQGFDPPRLHSPKCFTYRKYRGKERPQCETLLGVVYAVLLGLVAVAVWEQWNAAADKAVQEASVLAEVFWVADRMTESEGHHIQELVRSYARVVVEEEWPLMRQGTSSKKAWALLDEIRSEVQDFQPSTPAQQVLYEQGLERVHELADARRERLLLADHGLPGILWVVLMIGGVVVTGFTYHFGLDSTLIHVLMVAALALIIPSSSSRLQNSIFPSGAT
jgi:hypothetical protein